MFSYGSGSTATMFSLKLNEGQHPFSLSNIASVMNVAEKLKSRHEFTPEKFIEILKSNRAQIWCQGLCDQQGLQPSRTRNLLPNRG